MRVGRILSDQRRALQSRRRAGFQGKLAYRLERRDGHHSDHDSERLFKSKGVKTINVQVADADTNGRGYRGA